MAKLPAWAMPGDDASDGQAVFFMRESSRFYRGENRRAVNYAPVRFLSAGRPVLLRVTVSLLITRAFCAAKVKGRTKTSD